MGMIRTNDGRVIVAIPSMRKIGDSKWAVYFMEDNQLYTAIYYTERLGTDTKRNLKNALDNGCVFYTKNF